MVYESLIDAALDEAETKVVPCPYEGPITFVEIGLIIVRDQNLEALKDTSLALLDTGLEKRTYDYLKDCLASYHDLPTEREFRRTLSISSGTVTPTMTAQEALKPFKEARLRINGHNFAMSIASDLESGEVIEAARINTLQEMTTYKKEKQTITNDDFSLDMFKTRPGGVSTGIPIFDEATKKVKPGELCFILGRPQARKTTYATWLTSQFLREKKNVLLTSFEITNENLVGSIVGTFGEFNSACLRSYETMTEDQCEAAINGMAVLKDSKVCGNLHLPKDDVITSSILLDVAKSENFDALVVDSAYLMPTEDSRGQEESGFDWGRMAVVSTELRKIAKQANIPVFGIFQLKRGAGKKSVIELDDIAYSDSIGQIADFIIAIKSIDKSMSEAQLIKNRSGPTGIGVDLSYDYDKSAFVIGDTKDLSETVEDDDDEFLKA